MMKYSLVLLLGGKSTRFNGSINKVYELINDKPLFMYSLELFEKDPDCDDIIIVYNKSDLDILNSYIKSRHIKIVEGGANRYNSVLNGLNLVKNKYVLVHDGARCNIDRNDIDLVKCNLLSNDCVSLASKVTDTIKKVTFDKVETIDRTNLYAMKTPQGAKTELLKKALSFVKESDNITDDLMAIEKYTNVVPKIVVSESNNIKVTTKEDLEYIRFIKRKND